MKAKTFPDLNKLGALLDDGMGFSKTKNDFSKDSLNYSDTVNLISKRFEINTTYEIKDLSNDFVEVYPVNDIISKNKEGEDPTPGTEIVEQELFAYVFKKKFPIRINEIIILANKNSIHCNLPIAYGVCPIGTNEEERFVAIIPKQSGKSLRDILNTNINLDNKFIRGRLLPQILKALDALHSSRIAHGCINLDTIFFDKNGDLILKEFISEPSGYSQTTLYDTIERAQCTPIAKGKASPADDFYALGMVLFNILTQKGFDHLDQEELIREKLYHGSAHFLNAAQSIPSVIGELIKGLVSDNPSMRFSKIDIDSIISGKPVYYNSVDKSYFSRAIIFNGKEHYSKKSLAYDLFCNWIKAREYVKSDKIVKWLESIIHEEKTCNDLQSINIPSLNKSPLGNVLSKDDEFLIKTIIVLDPEGPIRAKNLCFELEGLGPLLCNSLLLSQSANIQLLASLIFSNIFSIYDFLKISFTTPDKNLLIETLDNCSHYIKKSNYGFGLERCLYELNPTLACQSHLVNKEMCFDLNHLLESLNKKNFTFEDLVSKKNISSFIGSKINIQKEIENEQLDYFPNLTKSRSYQILGIMNIAQKVTGLKQLKQLAQLITRSIIDALKVTLKSKKFKKLLFSQLEEVAATGSITDVYKVALNSPYLRDDNRGYAEAIKRGAQISAEIFSYDNRKLLNTRVRNASLNIAVKFSYVVCAIMIIMIFLGGV